MEKLYRAFIKRFLDIVLSLLALIALSPLFLLCAVTIKLTDRGPVFFTQRRVGIHKKLFTIHKFRTMRTCAPKECPTHLLSDAQQYITPIGSVMRKTSLDELPQLWDIVRGKMSFIGPRPALYNQYDLIALRDRYQANEVKPGLTGLAQIKGRDELALDVKACYDGEYCRNIGFFSDAGIFFATIKTVLKKEGVKEGGMIQ